MMTEINKPATLHERFARLTILQTDNGSWTINGRCIRDHDTRIAGFDFYVDDENKLRVFNEVTFRWNMVT